jgi:hypothetical protein
MFSFRYIVSILIGIILLGAVNIGAEKLFLAVRSHAIKATVRGLPSLQGLNRSLGIPEPDWKE